MRKVLDLYIRSSARPNAVSSTTKELIFLVMIRVRASKREGGFVLFFIEREKEEGWRIKVDVRGIIAGPEEVCMQVCNRMKCM
jgi:hypothetical protein